VAVEVISGDQRLQGGKHRTVKGTSLWWAKHRGWGGFLDERGRGVRQPVQRARCSASQFTPPLAWHPAFFNSLIHLATRVRSASMEISVIWIAASGVWECWVSAVAH
jgi:hypothetical protein